MKQRLLLALLVLFASVGSTWGQQITIDAPANSGDIKVQFKAASGGVGAKPTGITIAENAWNASSNSVTITIPSASTATTYAISRAEGSKYTEVVVTNATKTTGEITINDNVITSFTCKDNGLTDLTVTSASALTTLDCSNNKLTTASWNLSSVAPALTTLTCNNNQLTGTIALGANVTSINCTGNQLTGVTGGKTDADGSSKLTITAGAQTATYGQTDAAHLPHANEWFDIRNMFEVPSAASPAAESSAPTKVTLGFYTDASKVKVNSIKKVVNGSKTTANYITNSGINNYEYKFYSASNGYEYGSYELELGTTETGKTGITYQINFLVAPAKFTLQANKDDGISAVTVASSAATKVGGLSFTYDPTNKIAYQGNLLTITSELNDYYSFAKYTDLNGLKTDDDATKVTTMEVTGTKSKVATEQIISFKATSTIAQRTLTLVPVAANGSYTVTRKDGVKIENNKVPHGTEIVIEAFPDADYVVESITVGGTAQSVSENKVIHKVEANTTIAVTFKKKTTGDVQVTVYAPDFTEVKVNSVTWKKTASGDVNAFGQSKPISSHTFTVAVAKAGSNSIKVNSITMNNTTKGTVVNNGATFTVAETVTEVTFVVEAVEQKEPDFIPTATSQTVKYDGSQKTFAYTSNPAGEIFTLRYYKKQETGGGYDEAVTTAPTNVGEYKVQYKNKYTDTWLPTSGTTYTLTIEKADLTLSLPSISMVTTNGITKYQLSGGSASFNNRSVTGSFAIYNGSDENTTLIVPDANKGKSHTVTVKFVPKSAQDQANYNDATATVTINVNGQLAVETFTVKGTLTNGITVSVYNGNASINGSITNGISVAAGSTIRLVFKVPDGKQITDILNDTGSTPESLILADNSNWSDNTLTLSNLQKNINFALEVSDVAEKSKFKVTVEKDYETTYNGTVQAVNPSGCFTVKKADSSDATENTDYTLIYSYKQNGQVVKSPTNAGTYDVEITVQPSASLADHQATTASMKMIVKKATPVINTAPTASVVGKGAKLSSSILTGGSASVPGIFVWAAPETIVEATGKFVVIFKPTDSTNYEEAYGTGEKMAEVKVTDKAVLSISQNEHCTIKVTAGNKTYSNGETIPVGTTITITATPAATYKVTKILVNGTAISGTTYTTTAAPINISVEVEQEFTVSVSTLLKGIELVLPANKVVKKGESFSFSVKGLAADLAKLVVSDGAQKYAVTNGTCTITNITANKTITVTMEAGATPTPIDLTKIAEVVNSHMGKPMGTIKVEVVSATRAATTTAYYGDKIKLTATPAAGCKFVKWIGAAVPASQATVNPLTIELTSAAYEVTAEFAGSPTGAEVIEGVDIYGSNGEIVVKCDGAARITIVSMNGQSKQQEISGDTRIPAGAGIYGIVFEQGNNVMRTKVAVK